MCVFVVVVVVVVVVVLFLFFVYLFFVCWVFCGGFYLFIFGCCFYRTIIQLKLLVDNNQLFLIVNR